MQYLNKKELCLTFVRHNQIFIKNKGERVSNKFYLLAYELIIKINSLTNLKLDEISTEKYYNNINILSEVFYDK